MRVAFYAPLKAPDHPVPSGDRTMARALLKALRGARHSVAQPSALRSFLPAPDAGRQDDLAEDARRERDRIAAQWANAGAPDVWFTYHNHYKAPDLLGPPLARRFGLPYVVAEASHSDRRAAAWGSWHAASEAAIRAADLHLCFTARDRQGLAALVKPGGTVLDLPPFIDADDLPVPLRPPGGAPRLVTLAMMRPGDKQASYDALADALALVADLPWHLDIIGDGPVRGTIAERFSVLPRNRVTWHGVLERRAACGLLARADLLVWPGFGEAFGLAYLEAQAMGTPVLAFDTAGVSAAVRHGTTGCLVFQPSATAYADALRGLLCAPETLIRMGAAARRFVLGERTLVQAAAILDRAIRGSLERATPCHA